MGFLVAVVLIGISAVIGSGAVLTSTSASPANMFTAGNVKHTNSKAGTAIFAATSMKPGDTAHETVTIANDGDVDGTFSLSTSNLTSTPGPNGGLLSTVLQLQIVDTTSGATLYEGPVDAVGAVAAGSFAAGVSHTYEFTITFPDGGDPPDATTGDNAFMGSSMSIRFDWNQVQ